MPTEVERIPPNALEAEQAILGALLVNPEKSLAKIATIVKPSTFYRKAHQTIYVAIMELFEQKQPVDALTVSQQLADQKKLASVGGRKYITDLVMSISTTANVEAYAKSVKEKALLRKFIRLGHELSQAAYEENSDEALGKVAQLSQALEDKHKGTGLPTMTAAQLMQEQFPTPNWAVDDLLPEGLTVLAGAPKLGKSWMALQIALAVSRGEKVLGDFDCESGEVLYLALEDNFRRLQNRLNTIAPDDYKLIDNSNLILCTEMQGMEHGGVQALELWLQQHPNCRLIIIDTLAKFLPPAEHKSNAYQADYKNFGQLQKMAIKHRVALLGVHHVRKLKATDALDEVSGSSGVTGAADAIWVLKRGRTENTGTLFVTGRDINEETYSAELDSKTCRWSIEGNARGQERRELLVQISAAFGNAPFTYATAADALGISLAHAKREVNTVLNSGYVVRLEEKIGKAFQFRLTDRLADQLLGEAA